MEYPRHILNQLERDPIWFFGCTHAEITSCSRRGALFALFALIAGLVVHWLFALVLAFAIWMGYSYFLILKLATKRADKPLFYEVHLSKMRFFIKTNVRYQIYRNPSLDAKKRELL
ncbi:hypothetical protein AwWohl_01410 [Gammaproteobacteria bacterium]|nr:hypothetical protein AwWohl_01410 [Gammaproteobacteria bacterium]